MSAALSGQLRLSRKPVMPQQASAFPREEYIYYPNVKYGMRLLRGVDHPQK